MTIKNSKWIGAFLLCALFADAYALESRSPRLNSILDYQIGGGLIAEPPTVINTIPTLSFGAGWDMGVECGQFDPKMTVSNQLNGITDGFKNMMDNIISSATGAVASLPALAIQKADPGLYDLLQQGILQGKMDFEYAQTSCQEMAKVMMGDEAFPWEKYKINSKFSKWATEIASSGGDAVSAKDQVDQLNAGNAGAEWVCNTMKGGAGQPPIRALRDVVMVGYNVLFDRNDACDTSPVPAGTGQGSPLWSYWNGPMDAVNWAASVVGDTELRTCDSCKKLTSQPGRGLTYQHRDMSEDLFDDLEDLVDGTTDLTWQNLNRVSAPPVVNVSDVLIKAIRKYPQDDQEEILRKLSSEIAYTRLVEQGRLLTQMLRSGVKEPNVANMADAKAVINDAIDHLQVELDQLDSEIKTRQAIAKLTIQRVLGTEERIIQNSERPTRSAPTGLNNFGITN